MNRIYRMLAVSHVIGACLSVYFGLLYLNDPWQSSYTLHSGIAIYMVDAFILSLLLFVFSGMGSIFGSLASYFLLPVAPILSIFLSIGSLILLAACFPNSVNIWLISDVFLCIGQLFASIYLFYHKFYVKSTGN